MKQTKTDWKTICFNTVPSIGQIEKYLGNSVQQIFGLVVVFMLLNVLIFIYF